MVASLEALMVNFLGPVLHIALRAAPCDFYANDGKNVVPEVIAVRNQIKEFSHKVSE